MIENPDPTVPILSIHTRAGQNIADGSISIRQQQPFTVVVNGQVFETHEVMMGISGEQQDRMMENKPLGFKPAAVLLLDTVVAICADCEVKPLPASLLA